MMMDEVYYLIYIKIMDMQCPILQLFVGGGGAEVDLSLCIYDRPV